MKEVIKKIQELEAQKIERLDQVVGGNAKEFTLCVTCTPCGNSPSDADCE